MDLELKILVVADVNSVHSGRFIDFLCSTKNDIRVFPSTKSDSVDDHLIGHALYKLGSNRKPVITPKLHVKRGKVQSKLFFSILVFRKIFLKVFHIKTNRSDYRLQTENFINVLKEWKPDLVISLKLQNEGYLVSEAIKRLNDPNSAKWMHFLWGTDIEFFAKDSDFQRLHLGKVRDAISSCNYLIADTHRDSTQVDQYGFRGRNFGRMIATGGFSLDEFNISRESQSERQIILVKGRDGDLVGRAKFVLSALEILGPKLAEFEVVVILATKEIRAEVHRISKLGIINISCAPRVTYPELLSLFAKSCVAISATTVDGLPLFLAEAILLGAFPIHSTMDSIKEWVEDGVNGNLFELTDAGKLAQIILNALSNQTLRSQAEEINRELAVNNFSRDRNLVRFNEIFAQIKGDL